MTEYKDYARFESLSELLEAVEAGLDIEFYIYGRRYNISWRDEKPFICECPNGDAVFYQNAQSLIGHDINGKALRELWKDMEVVAM